MNEETDWWWRKPATGRAPDFDQDAARLAALEEDVNRFGPSVSQYYSQEVKV